ncbi:MAG: thymidine phosphorylase [Pirellulaceae bacterium]
MLAVEVIAAKRDGKVLRKDQIEWFVDGYAKGTIPDYQMAALAMAIYIRGMSAEETHWLTQAMLHSGQVLQPASQRPRVDKHSTGGLGDKTSLILAPLVACFDLDVPMISGRALGITGGTLDKLESIPGYRCNLNEAEISRQLQRIGCVITGASQSLVPADRKLYALRDVTALVPSIPLITASIMSKKLAENLHALSLDVKWGSAAFMNDKPSALILADSLKRTGVQGSVKTTAILSLMEQPLGDWSGNACEVHESIAVLRGESLGPVRELSIALSVPLLVDTGRFDSWDAGWRAAEEMLDSGKPLERFLAMVKEQEGQLEQTPFPYPATTLHAMEDGYLQAIDGQEIGKAIIELGGGRKVAGDAIDPRVSFRSIAKLGDRVRRGDPIAEICAGNRELAVGVLPRLMGAFRWSESAVEVPPLWERVSD